MEPGLDRILPSEHGWQCKGTKAANRVLVVDIRWLPVNTVSKTLETAQER